MIDARVSDKKSPSTKKWISKKLFGIKTKYLSVFTRTSIQNQRYKNEKNLRHKGDEAG